jgi:hypothetical protein
MPDEFMLTLDLSEVIRVHEDLTDEIKKRLASAAKNLAIQAHAHVKEQAAARLKTRRELFLEQLDFAEEGTSVYSVIVREKGRWIEDGMEPHSMLDDLLASPKAKTAKDGSKYLVVPFKHNKGPTQQGPTQSQLLGALKSELKKQKIPYGAIERNPDGSPKTGLLHKMDLNNPQRKRAAPGTEGPHDRPFNANSPAAGHEGPEGRPFLYGIRIYQKAKVNPDGSPRMNKQGQQAASREIYTFRVASSKQKGTDKWFHPGLAPVHLLDEAYEWAKMQWDNAIAPEIMRDLNVGL